MKATADPGLFIEETEGTYPVVDAGLIVQADLHVSLHWSQKMKLTYIMISPATPSLYRET